MSTTSTRAYVTGDRCEHHWAPVMCPTCSERPDAAPAYNLREEFRLATLDAEDGPLPRTSIPCPAWCTAEAGHPFDSYGHVDQEPQRSHERAFDEKGDPFGVYISSVEYLTQNGMDRSAPELDTLGDGPALEPGQARAFARALEAAADYLEELRRA